MTPVLDEGAFVGELDDALTGADALVIAAGGTDRQILLDDGRVVV